MASDQALRKVRTTIEPDREITVGAAEYRDLQRQGLLVADKPKTTKDNV